jgi:hypothetical protein
MGLVLLWRGVQGVSLHQREEVRPQSGGDSKIYAPLPEPTRKRSRSTSARRRRRSGAKVSSTVITIRSHNRERGRAGMRGVE